MIPFQAVILIEELADEGTARVMPFGLINEDAEEAQE